MPQQGGMEHPLSRLDLLRKAAVGGVALSAGGLLAENAAGGTVTLAGRRGGSLTVGVGQVIEDINPTTAGLYRWLQLIALTMYEPLVKYSSEGKVIPVLAESIQTSRDFKTTIFKLRKEVAFHNGDPFTADDVVNAIQIYNDPAKSALGLGADVYASVEKLDDYRVKLTTKRPYRAAEYIRWWFMFPKNSSVNLSQTVVGTGPFKLKSYTKGSSIEVVRNDAYWDRGKPYLDSINFRFLKDASAQIANFLSGDVNYLHDIPINLADRVKGKKNSKLVNSGLFFHWWDIQLLEGPLADLQVRKALLYAFDRQKINEVAWAGKGIDTRNPFSTTPFRIKYPERVPYDPDKAKSLLAKAGASDIEVPINVLQGSVQGPLEAQVIEQGFKAAGVEAPIRILDTATWQKQAYKDRSHKGLIENYGTLPFPFPLIGNYMLSPFTLPKKGKATTVPRSYGSLEAAKRSVSDAQLAAALRRLQRAYLDEVAVYHTFMSANSQVVPNKLRGLEVTKIGDVRFNNAYLA